MPSMQRTRQLDLDPETASRIGAVTAFETPAPSVERGDRGWSSARREPRSPIRPRSRPGWRRPSGSPRPSSRRSSCRPCPRRRRVSTRRWTTSRGPRRARSRSQSQRHPLRPVARRSSTPRRRRDASSRARAPASKPPSSVETTLAGEEAPAVAASGAAHRPSLWRGALLGVLCFLVGALGMVAIAWKVGLIGGSGLRASPDVLREPPPARPETPMEIALPESPRGAASARSVGSAAVEGRPVRPPGPSDARRRVARSLPRWRLASPSRPPTRSPASASPSTSRLASPSASRSAKVDGAAFLISGPGIAAGTALPASDDGSGVFRTTFTFLQGGHFDVAFSRPRRRVPRARHARHRRGGGERPSAGARGRGAESAGQREPRRRAECSMALVPRDTSPSRPDAGRCLRAGDRHRGRR